MKKNLSYVIFLFCVILLTSCSNKKEFTCVDIDTNDTGKKVQKEISKILGSKMTCEIYSDYIKFTGKDDTKTGYDSFTIKIVDDNTFEIPNNSADFSIIVDWYIPYIHKVWNMKTIYMNVNRSNGKYVNWTFE